DHGTEPGPLPGRAAVLADLRAGGGAGCPDVLPSFMAACGSGRCLFEVISVADRCGPWVHDRSNGAGHAFDRKRSARSISGAHEPPGTYGRVAAVPDVAQRESAFAFPGSPESLQRLHAAPLLGDDQWCVSAFRIDVHDRRARNRPSVILS